MYGLPVALDWMRSVTPPFISPLANKGDERYCNPKD